MDTFKQIAQFVRWQDWGPGKITILFSVCLYIAVAYDLHFNAYAITLFVFLTFAAVQSALGYVLNDWGDRELDKRQFKHNGFTGKSKIESALALTLIGVMAVISGLPMIVRDGFLLLWVAWVASTITYSLEPLRLKTKGAVGLIVSFVAQWFLPILITFAAFGVIGHLDMWLIAWSLTVSGMTLEIGHQRWDRTRDMLTRAQTFAVGLSDEKVDKIYAFALLADKLAIGVIVGVVAFALQRMEQWWALVLAAGLVLLYALLLIITLPNAVRGSLGRAELEDPYYGVSEERTAAQFLHQTMLNFVMPVILGLAAMMRQPLFGLILGVFLLWRLVLGGADPAWPLRALRLRMSK